MSSFPSMPLHRTAATSTSRWMLVTVISLALVALWDAGGRDVALARWWGTAQGFAWRDSPFLVLYMHEAMRWLGWLLVLLLSVGVWFPVGVLRRVPIYRRVQLLISILASLALVAAIKRTSATSCPWDLALFGGVADYVSHWRWGVRDGGTGHCFPAGHAAAGFAFVGGYFALYRDAPRAARWWLAVALVMGVLLGLAQQMRGAHYMSHTLWTAWLCWTTGWVVDCLVQRHQRKG